VSQLTGVKELDTMLNELPRKVARRVLIQAIGSGMTVLKRTIKNQIPGNMKGVRQAIGSKFSRAQRLKRNQVRGKVGAAVGVKKSRQGTLQQQHRQQRGDRPGVGIGARNVHWWLLGTESRKQKKTGRNTGSMPAASPNPIRAGLAASDQAVLAKMKQRIRIGVDREAAKLRIKVGT